MSAKGAALRIERPEFSLLLSDSVRGRAYCCALEKAGLKPVRAIMISNGAEPPQSRTNTACSYFDNVTSVTTRLQKWGIPVAEVGAVGVNSREVETALRAGSESLVVYCGPPGAIVGEAVLAAKANFLHAHPGRLPVYRGSTPFYYSLLADGELWVSAILLHRDIDRGPVVAEAQFPLPADCAELDIYDAWMRSAVIVKAVAAYERGGSFAAMKQQSGDGEVFNVIHPVLKHLAILKANRMANNSGRSEE